MKQAQVRLAGHALEHFRTGAQSGYANGRCKCGWRTSGWYDSADSVRQAYRNHLVVEIRREAAKKAP